MVKLGIINIILSEIAKVHADECIKLFAKSAKQNQCLSARNFFKMNMKKSK